MIDVSFIGNTIYLRLISSFINPKPIFETDSFTSLNPLNDQTRRSLGFLLLIMGIGSFILHAMNMEFRLLQWVDNWGISTGNIIRIVAAVLGVILIALSYRKRPVVTTDNRTTTD